MATNFQWQGLCWLKHWCWDSFPVLATMSIEGVCLIDHKIVGWSCPQKNIIIIEALISGGKKKMKIAQKLISNSNLINFRWNMNALEAPSLYMFNFAFLSREDYNKDDLCKLMQFSQNCPKSSITISLNWRTSIRKELSKSDQLGNVCRRFC